MWPFVDTIRPLRWRFTTTSGVSSSFHEVFELNMARIDLRETCYDFKPTDMITRDNVTITVHPMLIYKVVDPIRAVYEVYDVSQALDRLVCTTLRALIGDMGLDDTLVSRIELNRSLMSKISDIVHNWGIEVTAVEILEITPASSVQRAMHQQISAECTRRANVVESQGYREKEKLVAEGECKSAITMANAHQRVREIEAHGEAEARKILAKAEAEALTVIDDVLGPLGVSAPDYVIGMKYVQTIKDVLEHAGNRRIMLPYQSDIVGSARKVFQPQEAIATK